MRANRGPRRFGILLLQCLVVLGCVAAATAVAVAVQERSIRAGVEDRVVAVASSLAELPAVQSGVQQPLEEANAELQPVADLVARSADVDYVVITDDRGIRITHPDPARVGHRVSTDPDRVLQGERYLGTEDGTRGSTLRAKAPVRSGGAIVGTVSVGILESEIAEDFEQAMGSMLPWVGASVLAGVVLSAALTTVLNRRVRRLEDDVSELEVQARIGSALREQTHEFHTRMHVVRALVARGDRAEALGYIDGFVPVAGTTSRPADDPALGALLDALDAELGGHGVRFGFEDGDRLEPGVLGDDDLVLVSNLCRNAAEAGARTVRLTLSGDRERIRGSVDDDGPGVPPSLAPRLFERGVSTKADPSGTGRGIGLDVVRRIVGARDGSIEVGRSDLGGARFAFELRTVPVRDRLG